MPDLGSRFSEVSTLLCDADGTLFPSEEPAYQASAAVTQDFADRFGIGGDFSAERLRRTGTGKNFRSTATELLERAGTRADPAELRDWIERENFEVTAHLGKVLQPEPVVLAALAQLRAHFRLAAVSSSGLARLAACFTATGLDELIPAAVRFSAEDSLPVPTSKPDPAVYAFALQQLGITPSAAVAVEDSTTGASSAVAAGVTTIGIVAFVPPAERRERAEQLYEVGVAAVVESWRELAAVLSDGQPVAAGRASA